MNHIIITGDFPVLEAAFARHVRRIREKENFKPLLVLLPSGPLRLHLRRLLPGHGVDHFNLRLWTLEELARSIAMPVMMSQGKREIPPPAAGLIMGENVRRMAPGRAKFYFRDIAGREGFHDALLATIRDLKDACLGPGDLKGLLKKTCLKGNPKIRDLALLWERYEKYLAGNKIFDQSDLLHTARDHAQSFALVRQTPAVIIYGFYDFNESQRCLLEACCRRKEALVFLPYEKNGPFAYVEPTLEWLRRSGFSESRSEAAPLRQRSRILGHLAKNLFSETRGEKGWDNAEELEEAVQIISAPGETREVREVVRRVFRQVLEKGASMHEIAVMTRASGAYNRLLRETFEGADIEPCFLEGMPLSETRAGRSVLLLLEAENSDFQRQNVMEFATLARLPMENFRKEGEDTASPEQWDMISLSAGIVSGAGEWKRRLGQLPHSLSRRADGNTIDAVNQLTRFMASLIKLLQNVKKAKTWGKKADFLSGAFGTIIEDDEQCEPVKALVSHLAQLDEFGLPDSQIDSDFPRLVRETLESQLLSAGRFQRNGPTIGSLMALRGVPFKVVIMPGMVEKSFPPVIRQDAILLDSERQALSAALGGNETGPIPLKAGRRLAEERLLFRLAAGAAEKKLILSFPRLDSATGGERLPSSFILSAVEALDGKTADFASLENHEAFSRVSLSRAATEEPEHALDAVEFDLSVVQHALDAGKTSDAAYLGKLSPFFRQGLRAELSRWGSRHFTAYDGVLGSPEARKMLRESYRVTGRGVSPTRLETYAGCPFKYLLGSILGIKKMIEPERARTIDPMDRGKLIHDILYEFYEEIGRQRGVAFKLKESDAEKLLSGAGKALERFEKTGVTGYRAMWELEKTDILSDLRTFFILELGENEFLPAYFELRFGMEESEEKDSRFSTAKPVLIPVGKESIMLRGRIDRIDISPSAGQARVVDYKTGIKYGKQNDFKGGTMLQLPLYLKAAQQLLENLDGNIRVRGAEYYFMTGRGDFRRVGFDAEELDKQEAELGQILRTIASGIDSGFFPACPTDDICKYCDFSLICGSWKTALFERKRSDARASQFLKMRLGEEKTASEAKGEDKP